MKKIDRILFICFANISRSQMAEAFYNHYTKSRSARSAGVTDYREKYHNKPHRGVVEVMAEKGIDVSEQSINFLRPEMIDVVDKVVVFCDLDKCPPYLRESSKLIHIPIVDPGANINGPDDYSEKIVEGLRRSRDEIEGIVKGII